MSQEKSLHLRNIHKKGYDFNALSQANPLLKLFIKANPFTGEATVDYSNPEAVLALNQSLLLFKYQIRNWTIPVGNLCPPIPGREDYIHYIADLLAESNNGIIPLGTNTKGLDIGTGVSCIYPLLGNSIYGWRFVGSDINPNAINNSKSILNSNLKLKKNIKLRYQKNKNSIFKELLQSDEQFDFSMCNPPFYSSKEEAKEASIKKINNLNISKTNKGLESIKNKSNFGGVDTELWCDGGEREFIIKMIYESVEIRYQCKWFTTLVSNSDNLDIYKSTISNLDNANYRVIKMHQGKKIAHILAWSFKL